MQDTKLLYTANEGQRVVQDLHIPRWVDVLTFVGVALAVGVILGGAAGSGDPTALLFVQMTLGVMAATVGVLVIMLLINWIGLWGLLVFLPFMLLAALGIIGLSGSTLVGYWVPSISKGVLQVLKYGLFGFAGLAGLGLLARVMEKVGVAAFFMTLVAAAGIFMWLLW